MKTNYPGYKTTKELRELGWTDGMIKLLGPADMTIELGNISLGGGSKSRLYSNAWKNWHVADVMESDKWKELESRQAKRKEKKEKSKSKYLVSCPQEYTAIGLYMAVADYAYAYPLLLIALKNSDWGSAISECKQIIEDLAMDAGTIDLTPDAFAEELYEEARQAEREARQGDTAILRVWEEDLEMIRSNK